MANVKTQFNEYIGIAGGTITNGLTQSLEVYVPEFLPNEKECCIPRCEQIKACITDPITGATQCATMKHYNCVLCAYLGGTNQLVPCVAEGERVKVINFAGTEQYYWLPYGRDPGLRLHERCRWYAMAQPASVSGGTYRNVMDTNSYFIEMNTNPGEKEFHVHTSIEETEKHTYDIYIWPEKGQFLLTDDNENWVHLWSCDHRWKLHNTDDSYIDVDKENITLYCKDTITFRAGKVIQEFAGVKHTQEAPDIFRTAGTSITDKAPTILTEGSSSITSKAPTMLAQGTDITITGSTVNISGGGGDCVISSTSLNYHIHLYPVHCGITLPPIP